MLVVIVLFISHLVSNVEHEYYTKDCIIIDIDSDANIKKDVICLLQNELYKHAKSIIESYFDSYYVQIKDDYNRYSDLSSNNDVTKKYKLNDYVNASEIPTHTGITFIAAQLPKNEHKDRFIDLVTKTKSSLVLSFTHFDDWELQDYFRDILELSSEKIDSAFFEYIVQKFKIDDVPITRYCWTEWSDHSAPRHLEMLSIYNALKDELIGQSRNVVVHCVAGVGRTGTFIMFYILSQFESVGEELFVDVLFYLRSKRVKIVLGAVQLEFLYNAFVKPL